MTAARSAPTVTCPKCMGQMRSYERNGVLVDQCVECRGIYLDRGELERLIDIEGSGVDAAAATSSAGAIPAAAATHDDVARRDPQRRDHDDEDDSWEDSDRRRAGPPDRDGEASRKRRRGGLFGDVFDIFGGGE